MNEQERLNALEGALNNEMREREFYLKNAERTTNALGKKPKNISSILLPGIERWNTTPSMEGRVTPL